MEIAVKKIYAETLGTTADRSTTERDGWVKTGERRKDERF